MENLIKKYETMETATAIEKVIKGYNCKKILTDFIELSFYSLTKFSLNMIFFDNACSVSEFLVGQVCVLVC